MTIDTWESPEQLAAYGFLIEQFGPSSSLTFGGDSLQLTLGPDPSPAYAASRITEIDPRVPIRERARRWQPAEGRPVEVRFTIRFGEATASPELIANLILWNAPFPFQDAATRTDEVALPVTAFGVSRRDGVYYAAAAQDFDGATGEGLFRQAPIPAWLDPADWHQVSILLTTESVEIGVDQAGHEEIVLACRLLRAPDPLGFQFSIDNEGPGRYYPITRGDHISIRHFALRHRS
jgi:hypothetical protein